MGRNFSGSAGRRINPVAGRKRSPVIILPSANIVSIHGGCRGLLIIRQLLCSPWNFCFNRSVIRPGRVLRQARGEW